MILTALALLAAAPASAASAPPEIAASAEARTNASRLSQLVAPREIMVPLNMTWGERAVVAVPLQNEDAKALEAAYPGIHAAMWLAAKAEMQRQIEADLPRLWARMERVYLAELTPNQIDGVLRFFQTPTGQRMIAGMYSNIDLNGAIETMTPDGGISESALDKASEQARRKAVAGLYPDPEDLAILSTAVSIDRMRQVGARIQQTTSEWFNEENAEDEKKIEDLMTNAAEKFVAKADAGK